jgi:hypothetical protein
MFNQSLVGVASFTVSCACSLLLIGVGLWISQRVRLPCLPWAVACWVLGNPLLALFNAWVLSYLFARSAGFSLSGIGLFSKRDAMRQYMEWYGLISSVGFSTIALLVVADATLLIHQFKPGESDRVPRLFGLIRRFAPAFGLVALILSLVKHILSLLMERISP